MRYRGVDLEITPCNDAIERCRFVRQTDQALDFVGLVAAEVTTQVEDDLFDDLVLLRGSDDRGPAGVAHDYNHLLFGGQ